MVVENDERKSDDAYETKETTHTVNELPPRRQFTIKTELPVFLIVMGIALSQTPINNIKLYRICLHSLDHSKDECKAFLLPDKTNNTRELEEEVQKYTTFFSMVSVIQAVISAVLSLFIGAWSDVHGRKPLIVCPMFGMTVSAMLTVLYSMFHDLGPWWLIPSGASVHFEELLTELNHPYATPSDERQTDSAPLDVEAFPYLWRCMNIVFASF